MRQIRAAVGITLFMDSVLYLALVPFLPYYAEKFDLSKAEAGLVLAALPVAILIAAVPTGWLAGTGRRPARRDRRQRAVHDRHRGVRIRAVGLGAGGGARGAGLSRTRPAGARRWRG